MCMFCICVYFIVQIYIYMIINCGRRVKILKTDVDMSCNTWKIAQWYFPGSWPHRVLYFIWNKHENSKYEKYMCTTGFLLLIPGRVWWRIGLILMVDPLIYFLIQPVVHNRCNKHHSVCCPVCEMVHIKDPLLLIGKRSPWSGTVGFLSCCLSDPLP